MILAGSSMDGYKYSEFFWCREDAIALDFRYFLYNAENTKLAEEKYDET